MARQKINETTVIEDHAADQRAREKAELAKVAGERRKAAVEALRTELAYLERQPSPNERRIGEVKAEIARATKAGGRQTAVQD